MKEFVIINLQLLKLLLDHGTLDNLTCFSSTLGDNCRGFGSWRASVLGLQTRTGNILQFNDTFSIHILISWAIKPTLQVNPEKFEGDNYPKITPLVRQMEYTTVIEMRKRHTKVAITVEHFQINLTQLIGTYFFTANFSLKTECSGCWGTFSAFGGSLKHKQLSIQYIAS